MLFFDIDAALRQRGGIRLKHGRFTRILLIVLIFVLFAPSIVRAETGGRIVQKNGKIYFIGENGKKRRNAWAGSMSQRRYFGPDGAAYVNTLKKIDGKYYRFSAKGIAYRNKWAKYGGHRYYFGYDCAAYVHTVAKIDGKYCGFSWKGQQYIGRWVWISKKKYYFDKNGYALTGWQTIGGEKYYFNWRGEMQRNRWVGAKWLDGKGRYDPKKRDLKRELAEKIKGYPGNWSIYVKNLKTGETIEINADARMYAASLIKLFAMGSAYDRAKAGKLQVSPQFNHQMTEMITVSSNRAFDDILGKVGRNTMNRWIKKNGYSGTVAAHGLVQNMLSDTPSRGNMTTARDCGLFLEAVYRGKCVSAKYSKTMLNLLKRQTRRWKIPAGLPAGTVVANKTGETFDYNHDAAIIYTKNCDLILVVMSTENGMDDWERPNNRIGQIAQIIYGYYNP